MLSKNDIEKLAGLFSSQKLNQVHVPLVRNYFNTISKTYLDRAALKKANELLTSKKTFNKAEAAIISFSVLESKEVFLDFMASQPTVFAKLFERLLWVPEISKQEIETILQEPVASQIDSYNYKYNSMLHFFEIEKVKSYSYGYYDRKSRDWDDVYKEDINIKISLNRAYRDFVVQFFPKPVFYTFHAIPQPEVRHIYQGEKAILTEFPALLTYFLQDNIKYSEKGRPGLSSMKKIHKILQLKEFYDNHEGFHPIRTMLVAGVMYRMRKLKFIEENTPECIKKSFVFLFTEFHSSTIIANVIINQLKGISGLYADNYYDQASKNLWTIFTQLPVNNWVSFENLQGFVESHMVDINPVNRYWLDRLSYEVESSNSWNNKVQLNTGNQKEFLTNPFLKGFVFLFASFGLIDVAYDDVDTSKFGETWYSEYDGLKALRLTGLGAYVLGITNSYNPPTIENNNKVIFDEDNLIIRVEGNTALLGSILSNYVVKAGNDRFAFKPELFLKDCKNTKQIKDKIKLFTQSLRISLPNYWKHTFDDMITKSSAVIANNNYKVFCLNKEDKKLLRYIAQDEVIKMLVVKSEGFMVLVPADKVSVFKNRLLELGYLLEI